MKCKCGTEFMPGSQYCHKCGRKIPDLLKLKKGQLITIKPMPAVLNVDQCAELLVTTRPTVYKLIREEGLPWFPLGEHKRFLTAQVLEWAEKRAVVSKQAG